MEVPSDVRSVSILRRTPTSVAMPARQPLGWASIGTRRKGAIVSNYTTAPRARGLSIMDALLQAGPPRLRPILMTSAAIVLGMLPAAIGRGEGSEFRAPMSIGVIGSVITSTILTLVVVPILCVWADRLRNRRKPGAQPQVRARVGQTVVLLNIKQLQLDSMRRTPTPFGGAAPGSRQL